MSQLEKYAIIVVGYNRDISLKRLLDSIDKAEYFNDSVDLVISIDKSDNKRVAQVANNFEWTHGNKEVVEHAERMGLKSHILSCGEYTKRYKAIAVLEDDLIVSPSFYLYMKSAVEFYANDNSIAGISLYSHQWNVEANAPFYPVKYDYDVYFFQFAQSWGQVWTEYQWENFQKWYAKNEKIFEINSEKNFPQSIAHWGDNSWLKYHIKYCVEENKYFVYPYVSYTTNFTEAGTHNKYSITRFQVPLEMGIKTKYHFVNFSDKALRYDVFFENENLKGILKDKYPNILIDLYGRKQILDSKFCLTTRVIDRKILEAFELQCRPWELNILYGLKGTNIFIYDMEVCEKNPYSKKNQIVSMWNYYMKERFFALREMIPVFKQKIMNYLQTFI